MPHFIFSLPCTNSVALLDCSISPEVKVTIHWIVVSLYSKGIFLKVKCPIPNVASSSIIPSVMLRSSSRVPFTNHWICSTVPVTLHVNAVSSPIILTLRGTIISARSPDDTKYFVIIIYYTNGHVLKTSFVPSYAYAMLYLSYYFLFGLVKNPDS